MPDLDITVSVPVSFFNLSNSLATHEYVDIISFIKELSGHIADTVFDDMLLDLAKDINKENKEESESDSGQTEDEYSDELKDIFRDAKAFVKHAKRIRKNK